MAKILFVISLLIAFSSSLFAQEKSGSKAVEFMSCRDNLLIKEYHNLVGPSDMDFQVLIVTNHDTGKKLGCMKIEKSNGSETFSGTIDYEEIDACIKSIDYVKTTIMTAAPKVYSEASFRTLDGVSFSAFYVEKNKKWSAGFNIVENNYRSGITLDLATLETLKNAFVVAKSKIEELLK
ncbi:MAG: hypothetical protein MJZ01_04485 [Bacteroidales bacterium]|nr:hypothetical protein [Bacteroidales bacterium]